MRGRRLLVAAAAWARVLAVALSQSGAQSRRWALRTAGSLSLGLWPCAAEEVVFPKQSTRGQRAVGAPNAEGVDIDAALGIAWGGRERCDAADPECGAQGRGYEIAELPAPALAQRPKRIARLGVLIANEDAGVLRVALRDDVEAADVFAALASRDFSGSEEETTPAGLVDGGVEWCIRPARVTLAATAQAQELAFRRRYGLRKTPEDFAPSLVQKAPIAKPSRAFTFGGDDPTQPGVLVVAPSGPGPRLEFAIVGPAANRDRRRDDGGVVIGALADEDSMRLLARLANLPVVADRAALGGKACRPIVKLSLSNADVVPNDADKSAPSS